MLSEVYLGLGSNLGDRQRNIADAVALLGEESTDVAVSSCYETMPHGFSGQPMFVNAACRIWTRLDPFHLLRKTRQIQSILGSRPAFVNGPRAMDIDILVYGRRVLSAPGLIIPHPRMAEREFVLAPLAELAPGLVHPVLRETVRVLLLCLREANGVRQAVRSGRCTSNSLSNRAA